MANIAIITKLDALKQAKDAALASEYIAVDVETTGLSLKDRVVCIAFAPSSNDAFCVPIQIWQNNQLITPWSETVFPQVLQIIKDILQHPRQLYHNAAFDAKMIEASFGISVIDKVYCDTQLLHHTAIDENPPHGLKDNAAKYIDPEAANPQDDLKQSVLANGGKWIKASKDMYMGDWQLLATYNCWDVLYTYKLFELWFPEIEKRGLQDLWNLEVMPLLKVTYEMNTAGICINVDYFEKLKIDMETRIEALEDEIYASAKSSIYQYELSLLQESVKLSKASGAGKMLLAKGLPLEWNEITSHVIYQWYTQHKNLKKVFNLDSTDDKAFLLYEVLKLPITAYTASGKPSTNKAIIEALIEEHEDSSELLKLIKERSKELKLLNTYVIPILESHQNGKIYPSFIQTGTTSGRFSCGGSSINLQTLPRSDTRIKQGFIPEKGWAFVAADYSSLEPRVFAEVSEEPGIQSIFTDKLDFYSKIAIDVLGLEGVSADPTAENYLGTVDKEKRQFVKAFALAVPYGAEGGRIAQLLKLSWEEGKELVDKYLDAYPELAKWMDRCVWNMKTKGYVTSRAGRQKRGEVVHYLYTKYKLKDYSKRSLLQVYERLPESVRQKFGLKDGLSLYLECRNTFNVSRNHCIQSFAASIMNAAMVELYEKIQLKQLPIKIISCVHDELILTCPIEHAEQAAKLLQSAMESNRLSKDMKVPLIAEPIISLTNMADAK